MQDDDAGNRSVVTITSMPEDDTLGQPDFH